MTEERDLIDDLIDELNDGVDGVTFDRDLLDTDVPEDWGAVELSGQDDSEWADGHLIEQELSADVWVCLSSRGSKVKRQVQAVLARFSTQTGGGWRLIARAWLYDLNKVMWHWSVTMFAPLADDEPDGADDEPDGEDD